MPSDSRHHRRSRSRERDHDRHERSSSRRFGGDDRPHRSYQSNGGGMMASQGESYWEDRRRQRDQIATEGAPEAWGLSPKHPPPDSDMESPKPSSSESDSSDTDSSEDGRRRRRRHKKGKKSRKHSSHKKRKRKHDSDSDDDLRDQAVEQVWVDKQNAINGDVGPVPPTAGQEMGYQDYGGALLPGEGAAMAKFVNEGKRIPRRGEIGLTCDEITHFEDAGYVMSGSRHRRMEAVRIRKENQVYSVDDKKALAMFNYEERSKRENTLMSSFKNMVQKKAREREMGL
ncbi:NF-kappa-B-activating protein-like [Sycon ciliatum]|uniref:NF-kappa-B-activating protein-like n=1 Tax=Sycon ciliatum TaxID=27933 RepID=UPI0031F71D6A